MKKNIKEFLKIIKNFIKPNYIKDDMLKIPKEVRKAGFKIELLSFVMTVISLSFAFLLKLTNIMIIDKLFILAVMFFMLYRSENIIRSAFDVYTHSEDTKFRLMFDDELVYRGSIIISKVKDKVLKYDKKSNIYKVMTNEEILNSLKNYLNNYWNQKLKHIFDIYEIISIIVMIVVAIITNDTIPNIVFIPLIILFCLLNFIITSYINIKRENFYNKHREYDNEQAIVSNDLLRVPAIVSKDLNLRINKLKKALVNSNKNINNYYKKMDLSRLVITLLETICQYGLIIFFICNIQLNNLTLASITEITATLIIVENAIRYAKRLSFSIDYNNDRITRLERESEDIKLIIDVYHKVILDQESEKNIDDINIKPFTIKYIQESNNDIPFTLMSNEEINLNKGEVAILYGASGSGKSTFMKMITERIKLEKSIDIPSTSKYLFYDEKLRFGSLPIYEELFCGEENPNLNKMEDILKNLNLWYEIESISHDVWQFMREKKFEFYLSNGQKQRLILAKILYFLDNDIDALILDEATSGLDSDNNMEIDAQNVLEYIVKFANSDRKRIVVISTHQNLDKFKKRINKQFNIKEFEFIKDKEKSIIKKR